MAAFLTPLTIIPAFVARRREMCGLAAATLSTIQAQLLSTLEHIARFIRALLIDDEIPTSTILNSHKAPHSSHLTIHSPTPRR